MKKKLMSSIRDVRIGAFAPIDYETPFVEVSYDEVIIFDLSFEGDSVEGDILIMFHHGIIGLIIKDGLLNEIVEMAKKKLVSMA